MTDAPMTLDTLVKRLDAMSATLLGDARAMYARYMGELKAISEELEATPDIDQRTALTIIGERIARLDAEASAIINEFSA